MGVALAKGSLALACALSLMFLCGCSMPRIQIVMDGQEDTGPAEADEPTLETEPEPEEGAASLSGKTALACSLMGDPVEMDGYVLNVPDDFFLMETTEGFRQWYSYGVGMLDFRVNENGGGYFEGMTPEEIEDAMVDVTRDVWPDGLEVRWVKYTPECAGVSISADNNGDTDSKVVATLLYGHGYTATAHVVIMDEDYDTAHALAENIVDTLRLA